MYEIHTFWSFMWKIWYFHVPPCVHLCTPGREMATCTRDMWLPHPLNMPLNNPAKIQGIWAAGMYLCLCASQTRSDVSAGLGSNGRWYFRGTIKQLRSPESNYDFEPATLDFHHPHEASPGEMPTPSPLSMAGLYITLSLDLSSLTSSESSPPHLSPLVELAVMEFMMPVSATCVTHMWGAFSSPPDICFTWWGCKSKGASLKIVTAWKLRVMFYSAEIFRT